MFQMEEKSIGVVVVVLFAAFYYGSQDNYDPKTIADKRVLITGASSGIGEELAFHYSELGARLVLTAQCANLLEKVAKRCRELGAKEVSVVPADMGDPKDRIKVVAHTKKQLAGLDHLILNHAHVRTGQWQSDPQNLTYLETDMNLNLFSSVDLSSRLMPLLTESKGHIGVVSSVAGKVGWPLAATYSATKFAAHGFYTTWRLELGYRDAGVSVTLAVLGPISTELAMNMAREVKPRFDLGRLAATPNDTARAIVRAVESREKDLYYGGLANLLVLLHKIMPQSVEYFLLHSIISG